ncbi:MAG: tetratricopeptide repeat protein, partial [Myxococcaceae bacterium]
EDAQLGHMAYAAQLSGELSLCDELIALRASKGPTAEDLLLFAQVANLRSKPEEALAHLEASEKAYGERHPGHAFEVLATRGRAFRLLGKREPARAALEQAQALPEFGSARLGPKVQVDLGHLFAEEGDFERAEAQFRAALAKDPGEPEATHGLSLTSRRVAWRDEVAASAEARVEAARAEAEALKRRFSSREGELEALRHELRRMKGAKEDAEAAAQRAQSEAHRAAEAARQDQQRKVREELAAREAEAGGKAQENLDRALHEVKGRCPPGLVAMLEVAEHTFQKAMYTELPAAAVAVLYSGALERALYILFVERFDAWLEQDGRRGPFLQGAVREKRGKRVDYFDHFVEAFDRERAGRAPSMGEVGRVLAKRQEPYLRAFHAFLEERYPVDDAFYEQLAAFVLWSKEQLRDPVAHGRGIELGYDELKRFREKLLFEFAGAPRGMLAQLLAPKKG